ncbi:hypothetical protein SAMN05414139_00269 [Burkholderia sp. D7]|nr:hypothetical protein SAMN05414139_00269 [Burkholderia sp. D7]
MAEMKVEAAGVAPPFSAQRLTQAGFSVLKASRNLYVS